MIHIIFILIKSFSDPLPAQNCTEVPDGFVSLLCMIDMVTEESNQTSLNLYLHLK